MKKVKKFIKDNLEWLICAGVALIILLFMVFGTRSENGSITLDGKDAKIEDYTIEFVEDANAALARIMNQDKPTDEATITEHAEVDAEGQGFHTTLADIIARRKPDRDKDGGNGWQCSKYTAYLATGKKDYSKSNPDYGPVHGKNVAAWLVKNYGFKYIDTPVEGAIGSGGFNTTYGHTVMYLYSTGTNTAMVNDANWTPLTVSTHNMNIAGWVWVVPGDYTPTPPQPAPEPAPAPSPAEDEVTYIVKPGDTLGAILKAHGYTSNLFGDNGLAEQVAKKNGIKNRGLIYPGQKIIIK